MTEITIKIGSMHLWMANLLTSAQANEIEIVQFSKKAHEFFWLPETMLGEQGFVPLKTVSEQAFCQALAHRGCIPAALLFGFSLSNYYEMSPRVLHDVNAYEYVFVALEKLLAHHKEAGFAKAAEYFNNTDTLFHVCSFMLENRRPDGLDFEEHPVFSFCESLLASVHKNIKLHS